MFQLRLPEALQTKILNYYDNIIDKKYSSADHAFEFLNDSLKETIACHIGKEAISNLKIKETISNQIDKTRFYKTLSSSLMIEHFQEGDIILKQGDVNDKIFFIIDGIVEVISENSDYEFFDEKWVNSFFSELKKSYNTHNPNLQTKKKGIWNKCKYS